MPGLRPVRQTSSCFSDNALRDTDVRVVQGGFITSWLDHSMAVAVRVHEAGAALASLDINVSFLERVAPGPVVVEARVVRWGGRVAFLHAELRAEQHERTGESGLVLARATSTGMVLRRTSGQECAGPSFSRARA